MINEQNTANVNWIFENGPAILDSENEILIESIITLANHLGMTDVEHTIKIVGGYDACVDMLYILYLTKPFLLTNNKQAFDKLCEDIKNNIDKTNIKPIKQFIAKVLLSDDDINEDNIIAKYNADVNYKKDLMIYKISRSLNIPFSALVSPERAINFMDEYNCKEK